MVQRRRLAALALSRQYRHTGVSRTRCRRCGVERGARRAGLPRLAVVALEAPAHLQRAEADEPREKARVEGGADAPLDGITGATDRCSYVRA